MPAQPAPEGPKRWGGAYDTPEALERAYKDVLDRNARTEQAAQRLERLLLASLEGRQAQPGQPAAPTPAPRPVTQWNQQSALTAIKEEAARLGLDDPQADPQRFIRAIAAALREDPEARGLYVEPAVYAIQQQAEQQRQIQTLQTAFYTQYPDLEEVRPELLRQVAQETEARLYRANPEVYGSPEYVQQWFNETAREARAVFRVSPVSGTEGNGAGQRADPVPEPVESAVREAQGGTVLGIAQPAPVGTHPLWPGPPPRPRLRTPWLAGGFAHESVDEESQRCPLFKVFVARGPILLTQSRRTGAKGYSDCTPTAARF